MVYFYEGKFKKFCHVVKLPIIQYVIMRKKVVVLFAFEMFFRYISIAHITKEMEKTDVNVKVTVKRKENIKSWGKGGSKVSGLLCDASGSIDFIAWNELVKCVDINIQEGETYQIKYIRVNKISKMYSKSGREQQLLFTSSTVVEKCSDGPFSPKLPITKIEALKIVQMRE